MKKGEIHPAYRKGFWATVRNFFFPDRHPYPPGVCFGESVGEQARSGNYGMEIAAIENPDAPMRWLYFYDPERRIAPYVSEYGDVSRYKLVRNHRRDGEGGTWREVRD